MKIFDILSEEPYTSTSGGILVPSSTKDKIDRDKAIKDAEELRKKAAATRAKAQADSAARRQKAADIRKQNPISSKYKDVETRVKNSRNKWRANKAFGDKSSANWMAKYGTKLVWFMRLLGIVGPLGYLYWDLDALEDEYTNGLWDRNQYEQAREFLFGEFTVSVLTPAILRRLGEARVIIWIAELIKWALALAGGTVSGGATIAAAVATEGFFLWLQAFLSSGAGKDWLVNFVGTNIIRTVGKIPEGAWSGLMDSYKKSDQAKLKKQDPAKAAEVEKKEKQSQADLQKSQDFAKSLGI